MRDSYLLNLDISRLFALLKDKTHDKEIRSWMRELDYLEVS
jgi:hypothetical protein